MPKKAKTEKTEKMEKVEKKTKKPKTEKPKRKASAYAQFVKDHYKDKDVQALPPKQRFGLIAQKWKAEKAKTKK